MEKNDETGPLLIAAPLSLSGRYAFQGRLAAVGLAQAVKDVARLGGLPLWNRRLIPEVAIIDDESSRAGVRRALEKIARADLLIGPYGSDLEGEAARWVGQKGRVLWNHGGSADDVQRLPGVISVASPASSYFPPILEALSQSLPQARVLLAVGRGSFPEEVAKGAREAANRLGMDVVTVAHGEVPGSPESDVLLAAGTFAEDVALIGHLRQRPAAVGAVAAGIGSFHVVLAALADGVLGPSQWEESARFGGRCARPLPVGGECALRRGRRSRTDGCRARAQGGTGGEASGRAGSRTCRVSDRTSVRHRAHSDAVRKGGRWN